MTYSLDANVLLYASDRSSPRHDSAIAFLRQCADRPQLLCLTWPTVMAYLRIATHPGIFSSPLPSAEAQSGIDALLALPHVRVLSEQEGFFEIYKGVCAGAGVRGNLVPDAHVAAILLQNGVRVIYSSDRDFRRFEQLEVRDPFALP